MDLQRVTVVDPQRTYSIPTYEVGPDGLVQMPEESVIRFVKGNKADPQAFRQEGFTAEGLLSVVLTHLKEINVGELSSRETSTAITNLEQSIMWLQRRAEERKRRNVLGTYQK